MNADALKKLNTSPVAAILIEQLEALRNAHCGARPIELTALIRGEMAILRELELLNPPTQASIDPDLARQAFNVSRALGISRASGKTTALAQAAAQIRATFVVWSDSERDYVRSFMPELRTVTVKDLTGLSGPFIFDHHALRCLLDLLRADRGAE